MPASPPNSPPASTSANTPVRTLTSWLTETIATQLQLGLGWLKEQNRKKYEGVAQDPDSYWTGLFEDNGSCLDVVNETYPEQQSIVQIIGIDPLIISDGETFIEATLTTACDRELRRIHDGTPIVLDGLYSFVSVRKYTVRYTSYGPPRNHLHLILHTIDWQGSQDAGIGVLGAPLPLQSKEEIRTFLEQLKDIRKDTDIMSQPTDTSDENSFLDTTLYTQIPFGTQVTLPARKRSAERSSAALKTHAMQPRPIKPIGASQLLNLLAKNEPKRFTHQDVSTNPQSGSTKVQEATSRPESAIDKRRTKAVAEDNHTTDIVHAPISPTRLGTSARVQKMLYQDENVVEPSPEMNGCSFEPDWMTGWTFNHVTAQVTSDQRKLLSKDETWQKPQPGCRFPDANIPIKILMEINEMRDRSTAAEMDLEGEAAAESDPDLLMEEDPLPPSDEIDLDEDLPTSEVSWSESSSPEPQERPTRFDLPPDSSLGNDTSDLVSRFPSVKQTNIANSKDLSDPPSSPPLAPEDDSDEDLEMEVSVPRGLGEDHLRPATLQNTREVPSPRCGRAKSMVQVKETPYTKGRNGHSVPLINLTSSTSTSNQTSSGEPKHSSSNPIVFGTYNDPQPSAPNPGFSRRESKFPIPRGFLPKDKEQEIRIKRSAHEARGSAHDSKRVRFNGIEADEVSVLDASSDPTPINESSSYRPELSLTMTPIRHDFEDQEMHFLHPEPSPISAQVPPQEPTSSGGHDALRSDNMSNLHVKDTPPISVEASDPSVTTRKRKLDKTAKTTSRQIKRRELKVVNFGDPSPLSQDPVESFREQRKLSMERFRKERAPSAATTSFRPMQDSHGHSSPGEAGMIFPIENADVVPALAATVTGMDRSRPQTTKGLLYSSSPHGTPQRSLKVPSEAQRTDESGVLKQDPPLVPDSAIAPLNLAQRALSPTSQESLASSLDQAQSMTLASQSDLTTLALDENAISSTPPEEFSDMHPTLERILTNVTKPSMTVPHENNDFPPPRGNSRCKDLTLEPNKSSILKSGIAAPVIEVPLSREDSRCKNNQTGQDTIRSETKADKNQSTVSGQKVEAKEMLADASSSKFKDALEGQANANTSIHPYSYAHPRLSSTSDTPLLGSKNGITTRVKTTQHPLSAQDHDALTVFQRFKDAYPKYTGGTSHFRGQCKQMYALDQEDKMVPKWQWDDYLIRHRIDYKEYASQCLDDGEEQEPYHRFYKDNIQDTIFKKGVLRNRDVLFTALDELGARPTSAAPVINQASPQMRQSLPSSVRTPLSVEPAPDQTQQPPKRSLPTSASPAHSSAQDKPRRSLPWGPQKASFAPTRRSKVTSDTSALKPRGHGHDSIKPSLLQHQRNEVSQNDGAGRMSRTTSTTAISQAARPLVSRTGSMTSATTTARHFRESTGDIFTDYVNAKKRMTSWTGDRRHDAAIPSWPGTLEVRRTIERPSKGVDVLGWKDDL